MKIVQIVIEKTKDHYSAYAENVEGVYGGGDTAEEAQQSIVDAIRLLKEHNKPENVPAMLKGKYILRFRFDAVSFLNFYRKVFTYSAMEKMTGINQKQIQHYATGLKKPRETQVKKIETAFHSLGKELMAVELGF